jgi:hypothetical protein
VRDESASVWQGTSAVRRATHLLYSLHTENDKAKCTQHERSADILARQLTLSHRSYDVTHSLRSLPAVKISDDRTEYARQTSNVSAVRSLHSLSRPSARMLGQPTLGESRREDGAANLRLLLCRIECGEQLTPHVEIHAIHRRAA